MWVEYFDEITLSHMVKEIEANMCFCIFCKNSEIRNGRHFWERNIFGGKLAKVHSKDILWVENFDEIALFHMVKQIEANMCFCIFCKNSEIHTGRHFWERNIFFWKIGRSIL